MISRTVFVLVGILWGCSLLAAHYVRTDNSFWALFWIYILMGAAPATLLLAARTAQPTTFDRDVMQPVAMGLVIIFAVVTISGLAYG